MATVTNPILKGFNPDPSIIREGDDYYIATSTFEWFPGVQIHHSTDLISWELVARPLNRVSQLDMEGLPDSCGVWAPCLSYDKGAFFLVYSVVQQFEDLRGNTPNYLVTTEDILGEWSEPIPLGNYGFDGSLFHDNDGKKWFTSMQVHPEKGKIFGGIVVQEYDHESRQLVGPVNKIFEGTALGGTEAPHIYQRHGYYYLMLAEGGTEYGHAITLARSKSLFGPYEVHPKNPIITSRDKPGHPLQKAGHGDLVETKNGKTYCMFLVGRPLTELGRCTLGRETVMAEMQWGKDDWLYGKHGKSPPTSIEIPKIKSLPPKKSPVKRDNFESTSLDLSFQSLRRPMAEDWMNVNPEKGCLRLFGEKGLNSLERQSLVARRVQSFHIEASTSVMFQPKSQGQMAGLVCYYNTNHWLYAYLTVNEKKQRVLCISICDKGRLISPLDCLLVNQIGAIGLKAEFHRDRIQFSMKENGHTWTEVGPELDGSILSDDYVRNEQVKYMPAFTGAFVGICCQDLSGNGAYADFDFFEYQELDHENE